MRTESKAAMLPEVTDDRSPALVARNVPHDRTHGPTQGALLAFFGEMDRVAQQRLAKGLSLGETAPRCKERVP